jgi:hypothetical protein
VRGFRLVFAIINLFIYPSNTSRSTYRAFVDQPIIISREIDKKPFTIASDHTMSEHPTPYEAEQEENGSEGEDEGEQYIDPNDIEVVEESDADDEPMDEDEDEDDGTGMVSANLPLEDNSLGHSGEPACGRTVNMQLTKLTSLICRSSSRILHLRCCPTPFLP